MPTATQLSPTGGHSAWGAARRRTACPAFRLPRVSELPLRLEPVARDTFGGVTATSGPAMAPPAGHR
jgi:hypothetical protein